MSKAIGSASDFYRLRVVSRDTTDAVDLDWRDDVLYRRPPGARIVDEELYLVEAVALDDEESTLTLYTSTDPAEAHQWMESAEEDLLAMTRSQFEERYLGA